MSNNLGQIYATSKNTEKYIILDSQNVEVSGNFYINGTNSRLPAELENSIRNYLPLTYGTTDPNPNTLYDVISEVSNNLLISNNDALFGNVDISGNLTLKGSLGVLDTSTNDISYGLAGSVLTSNGDGEEPPSWVRPYFIKAKLESTDTDRNKPSRVNYQLTGFTEQFTTGVFSYNSGGDWSNDEWTCPQYGIYRISAQVAFEAGENDRIDRAKIQIRKLPISGGSEFDIGSNQLDLYTSPGTRDTADNMTPFMTILHEVQFGDKIRLVVSWEVSGSDKGIDYNGSTTNDLTYITIERVI